MNRMFYTPPVTKNLLIVNCLCFAAYYVLSMRGIDLNNLLGLHFFLAPGFGLWQLVTYMFMHANLQHIFFNMFALWMFGRVLEQSWGGRRYLAFYLLCGLGAGVCQELWQLGEYLIMGLPQYDSVRVGVGQVVSMGEFLNSWTTVGASGAIYGVLLGFGMSYPEERILIFPIPVPIKAKFFVAGYAVIEIFSAFMVSDNTAHFAHLGGMLVGWLIIRHYRRRLRGGPSWGRRRQSWAERLRNLRHRTPPRRETHQEPPRTDQAEIDRILEKVRRSGYSSLTDEEKQKLFDRNR